MEINSDYIDYLIDLAKEVEMEDPIDWGMLSIDEDNAYRLLATSLVENMGPKYDQPGMKDVLLATVLKLVVENFTLNLRLRER
jgi:hypothetical protein